MFTARSLDAWLEMLRETDETDHRSRANVCEY